MITSCLFLVLTTCQGFFAPSAWSVPELFFHQMEGCQLSNRFQLLNECNVNTLKVLNLKIVE